MTRTLFVTSRTPTVYGRNTGNTGKNRESPLQTWRSPGMRLYFEVIAATRLGTPGWCVPRDECQDFFRAEVLPRRAVSVTSPEIDRHGSATTLPRWAIADRGELSRKVPHDLGKTRQPDD